MKHHSNSCLCAKIPLFSFLFLALLVLSGSIVAVSGYTILYQNAETDKDTYTPGDSGSITFSRGFRYSQKYRSRIYLERACIEVEFGIFHYEGDRILLTEEDQVEGEFEFTIDFTVPEGTADGSYAVTWYITSKWWNPWGSGETKWGPIDAGIIEVKSPIPIPGFPWESILTGLSLSLAAALKSRRRKTELSSDTRRSS